MKVTFRKFDDGDVIALFPDEIADFKGNITSYMEIGQHSAASKELLDDLAIPTPDEIASLKKELEEVYDDVELEYIK